MKVKKEESGRGGAEASSIIGAGGCSWCYPISPGKQEDYGR